MSGYCMKSTMEDEFYYLAKELNKKLNIIPLMYGSLGLAHITSIELAHSDIDILIPSVFINENWDDLKEIVENLGYKLEDIEEHEFKNDRYRIAFSSIEELETFVGIRVQDIMQREIDQIKYKILNLEQYEIVYKKSIQDGYRIQTRNKKDQEKLELINQLKKKID